MTASRTSRQGRLVTAVLAVGAGAALALALTGCGSGQITQTGTQVPPVPGANIDAGSVALRNLVVLYNGPTGYPAGGNAPLVVRLFNNSTQAITLTGVSAPKAASVTLVGTPTVVTAAPSVLNPTSAPAPTTNVTATATGPANPTATGTALATGTVLPTATVTAVPTTTPPAPMTPVHITIPAQSYVLLVPGQGDQGFLQLNGLSEAIVPGGSTPVTFTFDNGKTVNINVPLAPPITEVPRATPVVAGEGREQAGQD